MHGSKVQVVYSSRQMLGKPCFLLNECLVDQQLGRSRGQLHGLPFLYLLLQRSKVSLHPIDTNGQAIFQREMLGMLCQDWGVFPVKGKVLADEDSQANGAAQAERLVVAVPQADCESASI